MQMYCFSYAKAANLYLIHKQNQVHNGFMQSEAEFFTASQVTQSILNDDNHINSMTKIMT